MQVKTTEPTGIIHVESVDSLSRDGPDTIHEGAGLDQYTNYNYLSNSML